MFGIKKLRKKVEDLESSQEMFYKSARLALNQYGQDIRAIIDTLIKKKIIKVNKKTLEQSKRLFRRG